MKEFAMSHEITHLDGWSYTIREYDDGLIRIAYREADEKGEVRDTQTLEGICPDVAREIAGALVRLADRIEGKPKRPHSDPAEFQKGFYAGLAYGTYGDEAIEAASDAAERASR